MKFLLLLLALSLGLQASNDAVFVHDKTTYRAVRARVTFYHPYQDKWGWQNACQNTRRSKEGITVAAHPDFKFGTKLIIPALSESLKGNSRVMIVQDRGGDITKKKASNGKTYVFDVFVESRAKYRKLRGTAPEYVIVYIENK